ncbi:MAG: peptidoglycan-binding protein [Ketobacter sp.]|nr:peptidoglycan-binding protein [Ketobacter sp.]
MSIIHIVKPGENLAKIARRHKIANWRDIYHHADNAQLRKRRPNPNILFAGDEVFIPEQKQKSVYVRTGAKHRFVVKEGEPQTLVFRLTDHGGRPMPNVAVDFQLDGRSQTRVSNHSGEIQIVVKKTDIEEFPLNVYADPAAEQPSHRFIVKPGFLDPVDTVSGIQARLNSLGHDCGVADGIYGNKTKAGIESFEQANDLPVTGQISASLYGAVEREYGC